MNDVILLLDKVESLDWKYSEVLRDSQYTFNIFALLRSEDDEVNLHSRFLCELLDPQGTHAQGDAFLDLFLNQVGITGFGLQDVRVQQEYRSIDMFIANESQAIIIENKLYAPDQDRQLERYYRATKREGFKDIFIVYLTLDGDDPSSQSVGDLGETERTLIRAISYRDYTFAVFPFGS